MGSPPGEGDVFPLTIGEQFRVDELAAIIRIQPQQRERE